MSEWNFIHENFHTKHSHVHSARCTHAYITQLYIMSREREKETDRQTDRQRQTETETDRETERDRRDRHSLGQRDRDRQTETERQWCTHMYIIMLSVKHGVSVSIIGCNLTEKLNRYSWKQYRSVYFLSARSVRARARTHARTHAHARTHTENSNSSSKTLFYKDCSLGSVKNLSNN